MGCGCFPGARDNAALEPKKWRMNPSGRLKLAGFAEASVGTSPKVTPGRVGGEASYTVNTLGGLGIFASVFKGQDYYNLSLLWLLYESSKTYSIRPRPTPYSFSWLALWPPGRRKRCQEPDDLACEAISHDILSSGRRLVFVFVSGCCVC